MSVCLNYNQVLHGCYIQLEVPTSFILYLQQYTNAKSHLSLLLVYVTICA